MISVSHPQLKMTMPRPLIAGFASLLQHGILLAVEQPVAIVPLLLSLPGFTAAYIEQTVQTIFVNGVAADSLDRRLGSGATLALSAAMPGLAGAIFRRQGVHGSLRSTPVNPAQTVGTDEGFITLKLFNSIAVDRVQDLLVHSIVVHGKVFADFAAKREDLFQQQALHCSLDGRQVSFGELLTATATLPLLTVQVVFSA